MNGIGGHNFFFDQDAPDENCPGCLGGDKVPPGYFVCPVCDTEYEEDRADEPPIGIDDVPF